MIEHALERRGRTEGRREHEGDRGPEVEHVLGGHLPAVGDAKAAQRAGDGRGGDGDQAAGHRPTRPRRTRDLVEKVPPARGRPRAEGDVGRGQGHAGGEAGRVRRDPERMHVHVEPSDADHRDPGERYRNAQREQEDGSPWPPGPEERDQRHERQQGVEGDLHGQCPGRSDARQQAATGIELREGQVAQPRGPRRDLVHEQGEADDGEHPVRGHDSQRPPPEVSADARPGSPGGVGLGEWSEEDESRQYKEEVDANLQAREPRAPRRVADGPGRERHVGHQHTGRPEAAQRVQRGDAARSAVCRRG